MKFSDYCILLSEHEMSSRSVLGETILTNLEAVLKPLDEEDVGVGRVGDAILSLERLPSQDRESLVGSRLTISALDPL